MQKSEERRRYIRLATPIDINYVMPGKDKILRTVSKNISAVGVRIETRETLEKGIILKLDLELPNTLNPVHAQGKVVWIKRVGLEDNSPYDIGIEFTKIEEDNKNTFLKYLCDVIYTRSENK